VYGWPEEIHAKVVKVNQDVFVAPLYNAVAGNDKIDKADISVFLKIGQLYELMNRLSLGNNRVKIVVLAATITPTAEHIAGQCGIKCVRMQ